ncbi:death-inducer obliterator 1 isoform X2 [Neocloeon triangulifer]|uniref:death-inducer obliterator 1 isoform X2 n=1 Tax=Neocloeon triangulifer TaxID=2078957 RepID=UPI00286EF347|nr:death-inducer obliterator 1 isoform X2 [Neocloeon triangulifer]
MSSSFVADTSEQKQDGSVVIVLNEDGTVSLDEQTLQKLLAAKTLQQQVSVVRMNQSGEGGEMMSTPITLDDVVVSDEGQPEVNLTVEGFYPSAVATDTTPSSADPMNPFMQMDPEQLEKLENALQSEQAKQILGEGVSAMLAKEEKTEESSKKATSIQLDHCYTGSSKSGAAEVSAEETESDEEELERKRRSQRGKGRATRGGKTVPVSPAKTRTTPPAATRKSARAQAAAPAPPPESTPPAELTKLGQSPAKTLLRTSKVSPVKKEPVVVPERKTYPQRTNRKPPAHLADAYGPGIFSSPDTPKKTVEVAKKEPVLDLVPKVEEIPSLNLDIIPINSAQALLEPEAIEELQAVLSDLGPEILKPLEEAKAEMDEALMEEAEEQKVKAEAIAARRRSSSSKASVTADDEAGSPSKSGRPPRKAGLSRVTSEAIKDIQAPSDEEDSGDEEGDEEWDSEDDPDKLWCICRKPHNNRFMICCDKCEDWFHGKCVGITKAMGKQMELEGKEWTCPKCKKLLKQNEIPTKIGEDNEKKIEVSSPAKARRSSSTSSAASTATVKKSPKPAQPADKPEKSQVGSKLISKRPEAKKLTPLVIEPTSLSQAATPVKKVSCLVCKKPARTSSIYCSDDCILIHAQDSLTLLKKEKVLTPLTAKAEDPSKSAPSENSQADTSENRVLMFEQKTGRILAGTNAPTESNLKTWLKEHPTYQVCKPNLVANIRQKLQKLTGDKQQIYIKPQHPKVELNDVPILGLPMRTPKTPQTPISRTIVIPSQRLPLTGKSPSPTIKTVMKADAKGTASTLPAAGTKQPTVKTVTKIQSAGVKSIAPKIANKEQSSSSAKVSTESSPAKKQASVEATRLSVRNSLQDVFKARMVECKDLKVSENELKGIATSIEEELYAYFKDTGAKYKAKFRSIHFNVKDPKNLTLFKKIITGEYIPHQLVRLSSEDLASKELAEWREQEEKHQIEMIKKTEMDLLQQNVTYIKTHKGEQMIETEDSLKLQTDAVEAETAVEPIPDSSTAEEVPNMRPPSSSSSHGRSKSSSSKDKERSTSSHKHHHKSSKSSRHHDSKKHSSSHKSSSHSKEKSHSKDSKDSSKEKDAKTKSDSHSKSSSNSRRHSRHGSSDHKTRDSEEKSSRSSSSLSKTSDSKSISKDKVTPVVEELSESAKEIMEKLEKIKSGTLTPAVIPPEEETLSDREPSSTVNIKTPESVVDEGHPPIWKGLVTSQDVSNFKISIYEVSGSAQNFGSDFPKECDIVGRIAADTVEDYITKVKKVGTKDIMVVKLMATSPEDKQSYITYYNYLLNRNRFGVVGKKGSKIKDFYIFPLPSKSPVPQFLLPFDGPGLDENRPNLLLGVVVQMYRKRAADSGASAGPSKISKSSSKFDDRSYTPPLPDSEKSAVSSNSVEPYSPTQAKIKKVKVTPTEEDEPYSPTGGLNSPDDIEMPLASELEELNRKIEEEKLRIETISSELVCTKSTGPFGEPVQVATFLSNITSDLVSSQPSAIPGLSETIVESSGVTLKGSLAMDKGDDDSEAYSPSRSFTPPPQAQSIPFFNDTSTISLPSNLQEILASITKKPSVPEALSMGLALDCDPIVREYADETLEEPVTPPLDSTTKALMEIEQFESDMKNYALSQSCAEQPRDPRQKQTQKTEKQSALSKMSEADLIAKANEMLMEQEIAAMPAKPPQAIPFVPPPQTGFPQMHVPPPMPPMVPSVFDIPPPPPGIDFKDQDMRQLQQPPSSSSNERKGISFKVTKKPNLPRWDRKRQDDWDTDSSGTSYSKRGRLSPLPK